MSASLEGHAQFGLHHAYIVSQSIANAITNHGNRCASATSSMYIGTKIAHRLLPDDPKISMQIMSASRRSSILVQVISEPSF
jgi:hypothetical protein